MTQEQELTVESKADYYGFYKSDKEVFDTTPWAQRGVFTLGAKSVIHNPTDFGLVTVETMFEFAEYLTSKCTVHSQQGDSHRNSIDGYWYTTQDLFQLFTQNK